MFRQLYVSEEKVRAPGSGNGEALKAPLVGQRLRSPNHGGKVEELTDTRIGTQRLRRESRGALTLRQPTSADVLAVRGVLDSSAVDIDVAPLRAAILADLPALLAAFKAMRAAEGLALNAVIGTQLDQIDGLVAGAVTEGAARRDTPRAVAGLESGHA